jgi:hypothetical protein
MKRAQWFRWIDVVSALAIVSFAGSAYATGPGNGGPLAMVITYHTTPANRLAFRRQLETTDIRRFERWRDQGILQSYRILSNRHLDSGTWDASVLLTFPSYLALERWNRVERAAPAGLAQKTLALTTSIDTAPADLVRKHDPTGPRGDSVFMVLPYDVFVPTDEYLTYLDGYVVPQLEGWITEGALTGYGIFLPRYYAGRPWSSLLVLEYKNDQALGMREAVVAKVRARLKEDPQWKAMSDAKKKIREEKQAVIADPITMR